MSASKLAPTAARASARGVPLFALLLLAAALGALFHYKWGGALRAIAAVHAVGGLSNGADRWLQSPRLPAAILYFKAIAPALGYGLVVGAALQAVLPPRALSRAGGRWGALAGGLAGAPLMLCSCCVTPVFTGVRARGARLAPAMALLLASPGCNPAAILLTFVLLPHRLAVIRLVCALLLVATLPPLVDRLYGDARGPTLTAPPESPPAAPRALAATLFGELWRLALATVPLIALGVIVALLPMPYLSRLAIVHAAANPFTLLVVAAIVTLLAFPTFFELAIALLLLHMGAPAAVAVIVLVAAPIVNLSALLVVGRETRPEVAVVAGVAVWLVATSAALLA